MVDINRNFNKDIFRRARNENKKKDVKQWFYFKDTCKECTKYNECTWITKYYVDIFWDNYLTFLK